MSVLDLFEDPEPAPEPEAVEGKTVLVGGRLVPALETHPYVCPLCGRHYRAWFISSPVNYNCYGGCPK